MSFAEQVSQFVIKVEGWSERNCRELASTVGEKLIMRTPVGSPEQVDDPGQARGNWQTTIGSPASGARDNPDPSGTATIAEMKGVVKSWKPNTGDSLFITNNLSYIPVLEYGLYPNPPKRGTGRTINGFSTQAPNGMVGITVAEFNGFSMNPFAGHGEWDIGGAGE
jgi:hypothetical protein